MGMSIEQIFVKNVLENLKEGESGELFQTREGNCLRAMTAGLENRK